MARILVVDDSLSARWIFVRMLKAGGHEVLEASSGRQAVKKTVSYKPDCMLLDLLMPEMDGFEVLNILKRKGLTIPVIVLSADIQETTRTKCLELGAVDFLNKPPEEAELLDAVKNVLGSKGGD